MMADKCIVLILNKIRTEAFEILGFIMFSEISISVSINFMTHGKRFILLLKTKKIRRISTEALQSSSLPAFGLGASSESSFPF